MGWKETGVCFKIPKLLLYSSSQLTIVQKHEVGVSTVPGLQTGSLRPRPVEGLVQVDVIANSQTGP